MIFGCIGAAYGTAKSGIGIAGVGTYRPDLIMKVCTSPFSMAPMMHSHPSNLVPHPRRHVWYHCSLRTGHRRPHRW